MKFLLFLNVFFLTSFFICAHTHAAEPRVQPEQHNGFEKAAIQKNIEYSEKIDRVADQVDLFFAGRRFTRKPNDSEMRISYFGHQTEGERYEDKDPRVDLRLRLPNTEEHWQLVFTSDEDNEFESLDRRRPGAAPGRQRYGVGVGLGKKIGKWDSTFRPGLKLKDPVETSYTLDFRKEIELGKLVVTPEFDFFADSQRGTGEEINMNIDYEYRRSTTFRLINEEQYLDKDNLFSTNHGPAILYKKSDKVSYTTSLTFYSTNKPVFHLDHYTYLISRRQQIYKNILYYQLTPSWTFDKERDWKALFDMAFRLDLIF